MGKHLEFLSEECPVERVIVKNINAFAAHGGVLPDFQGETLEISSSVKIVPFFNNNKFSYMYEVIGIKIPNIERIFITIVKGSGSFVDYIAILRDDVESVGTNTIDNPIALVEVTKTSDGESRNSASAQRLTKFVSLRAHYDVPIFLVYDIRGNENVKRSDSARYGDRIAATMGIKVVREGHVDVPPFKNLEELLLARSLVKAPVSGKRVFLDNRDSTFFINAWLSKNNKGINNNRISHDPNIGFVAAHIFVAREIFKYDGRIVIDNHGITSLSMSSDSKLVRIMRKYNVEMEGINLSSTINNSKDYYTYDTRTEKVATILLATLARNNDDFHVAYENHAGSERGYFVTFPGSGKSEHLTVSKKINGVEVRLPDLVLVNKKTKIAYIIEGEQGKKANIYNGLKQLDNFDLFKDNYLAKYFPGYRIESALVTNYGALDDVKKWATDSLFFHVDSTGALFYGDTFPEELKVK